MMIKTMLLDKIVDYDYEGDDLKVHDDNVNDDHYMVLMMSDYDQHEYS